MIPRDQFIGAISAAAGAFYDALTTGRASASGSSSNGGAPKFDTMIARKGGLVQYASETDLDGLRFWQGRAAEPASDPKYTEANAKQAKALGYWIAYREAHPDEQWRGERNRVVITAKIPSSKPELYERERAAPQRSDAYPDRDAATSGEDMDGPDEIPF